MYDMIVYKIPNMIPGINHIILQCIRRNRDSPVLPKNLIIPKMKNSKILSIKNGIENIRIQMV